MHNALKQPNVDRHLHFLQVLLICLLLKMNECCHEYSTQILVNPCKHRCYLDSPLVALLSVLSLWLRLLRSGLSLPLAVHHTHVRLLICLTITSPGIIT